MKNEPQLSAENPQDAFTTEQAYQEYEQFVEMIKREGSMNTPCKKCNELNKPCCDEHSGKIAEPQLNAEMEKRLLDLLPLGLDDWLVEDIKHFLATALEEQEKEYFEKINIKNKTIEHMMEEIRYLRSSQPERRKPIVRIKNGDNWYIPMITQAHDTPDGLYIEAELAILNGKDTNEK